MQVQQQILLENTKHQRPILGDVFYKQNGQKKPLVIFCHGYKGYKDWGAWNLAAASFAAQDLFFLKFNFSHNGGNRNELIDFPDLEAFGQNNYCLELDDLETVINWIQDSHYASEINLEDISLVGHSRGGGIVLIKAAENSCIKRVISWAGVSDYAARFPTGEELEAWKETGVSYVENARTKQQMPHYYQFFENFKAHEARLTIQRAVSALSVPQLVIQGACDEVVLPQEARNLHAWNPQSTLSIIEGMNHALGAVQPWKKNQMPEDLAKVVAASVRFVKNKI